EQRKQIGPLITDKAVAKVRSLNDDAEGKGAEQVLGGQAHALGGNFFEPTVLANVGPGLDLLEEEIFGHVSALLRFSRDEEVIAMAI
ncbi:aldehyde dehydrogenase family protein, partial [Pseudomonas sp. BJa5]|uniref:aldehyde dehydrogenase family protein n=1 Tax=Pseudomonas sp. BJa5 TaxID=2936270 RepID=UPI00255A3159